MKYSKLFISAIASFFIIIATTPAQAVEFNVTTTTGGNCAADPNDCTFQEALTEAQANGSNDTINLAAGLYDAATYTYTAGVAENNSLEIVGESASSVILDGDEANQVLDIDTTAAAPDTLAHVTIKNVTITGGTDSGTGGGVDLDTDEANITIEGCEIKSNVADDSGGMDLHSTTGNITLNDSIIFGNASLDGDPGGVEIDTGGSGTVSLARNSFIGNVSEDDEGALQVDTADGALTMTDNIISQNSAVDDHGGIDVNTMSGDLTLTGNTITHNVAAENQGGADIGSTSGKITLIGNTVSHNAAVAGDDGGLNIFNTDGDIVLVNNIVNDNSAKSDSGGVDISNINGEVFLTNNTVVNNTTRGNGGGVGVRLVDETTANAQLYNNIIFGNTAFGDGDDLFIENDDNFNDVGATVILSNNDFEGIFTACEASAGCSPNFMETANIIADPLFADEDNDNFNLLVGSPAINTGTSSAPELPADDHDEKTRVVGSEVDMGALETSDSTVDVSPSLVNLGDVVVGQNATENLTLSNNGVEDVSFSSMDLSDADNYSLNVSTCGSTTLTLGASSSCILELVFGPNSEGLKSATLTLNSDSADTPSLVVRLFGAGTADTSSGAGTGTAASTGGCSLIR